MDWKKIAEEELRKVIELADYDSPDPQARERLQKIREKAEAALEALKQS